MTAAFLENYKSFMYFKWMNFRYIFCFIPPVSI